VTIGESYQSLDNISLPIWASVISPPHSPFPPLFNFTAYEDTSAGSLSICVPPIRGDIPVEAVKGFLDTYRKLGVDVFYVYNMSGKGSSMSVLSYASDVQIVQFSLPPYVKTDGAVGVGIGMNGDEIFSDYKLR
jgi:hypothetical protein